MPICTRISSRGAWIQAPCSDRHEVRSCGSCSRFAAVFPVGGPGFKRRAAIVMNCEAADGSPSEVPLHNLRPAASPNTFSWESGRRSLTKVIEQRRVSEPALSQLEATKASSARRSRMAQWKIPCLFMRGGTSRGTYFMKQHLPPVKTEAINKILLQVMGSPDQEGTKLSGQPQINGLGGTTSISSKVAILSVSKKEGIDIDYHFAQVSVNKALVDWEPSCGNMLAGVGPAAIEMGLIPKSRIGEKVTPIKIYAVNNGAHVEAIVQTPNYEVTYDGNTAIDGVPGTAAPVTLNFMHVVGSKTHGKMLPTGNLIDVINDVEVTCIDVAMPIVIAKASSLGKTGYETKVELDKDKDFFERIEAIRLIAGKKMGLGDVSGRVIPKFAIVAEPSDKDQCNITARYFVPDSTHGAMAVTGAICVGCCSILKGSVADAVSVKSKIGGTKNRVVIEHPSGRIQTILDTEQKDDGSDMIVNSAGILRTCRLIFEGQVTVNRAIFKDAKEHQGDAHRDAYRTYQNQLQSDFRQLFQFAEPVGKVKTRMASRDEDQPEDPPLEWIDPSDKSAERLKPSVNAALRA